MEARVIEPEDWIETEFGATDLGDARRTQRLLTLMGQVAARPGASLPEACGSRGQLKAAYRFLANEAIEPAALWASHIAATYARAAGVPVVLAVQDTTELDWGPQSATAGLGPLGAPSHQGLLVHTTLAFTPERVPLGVVAQAVWARDPGTVGQRETRRQRPIAEKESYKWLESLQAVGEARQACPQTHWVSVGDREADVYDLLVAERPAGVDLLVRAAWDRRVEHPEQYLWATVSARPVAATLTVHVPRHGGQAPRQATLSLRFGPVTLRPPRHRRADKLPAVTVWAVYVVEEHPPVGGEPLEWLLLATEALPTVETAGPGLAHPVCYPAQPYPAGGPLHGPLGPGGMAGALLRHASHAHAAAYTTHLAASRALDCALGRLFGATRRRRTRSDSVVERVSTFGRSDNHVLHYAPSLP